MRLFGLAVVLAVSLTFAPLATEGQPAGRTATIGYLGNSSPTLESNLVQAFREGLRRLGYVEGQNLVIKYVWAEGQQERYAVLARELVSLKPDVILAAGTQGTLAAKQATQSIPIVTAVAGEPVAAGLVSSLARLELFKEAVPKLSRVVALLNPANPFTTIAWKATQRAAEALGVKLQPVEARSPDDLDRALATIKAARPDGLIVLPDRLLLAYRESIVQFMTKNRLPGMFPFRDFAQEGGLMAYGPDYTDMFRRAATYVDKILKGAKPGDLPIEQPSKFELVINLKTAKALGLTIPQTVLLQATQVIE
jgi:putative ABC transport system substrate-binding protein